MSANSCDCNCVNPTVVEIPGSPGEPCTPCADGDPGVNAYTTLTSSSSIPVVVGNSTTYAVANSAWMAIGQKIFVSDGTNQGTFDVLSLPGSTSVELTWLQYPDDSAGGSALASGAIVTPAGSLPSFSPPADLTNSTGGTPGATLAAGVGISTLIHPLTSLVTGLGVLAIDIMSNYVLGYRFKIISFDFVTTVVGTNAGASQVFNIEIGSTNLTGGVLTVNLAGTATIGQQCNGTPVTANNVGSATDNISIEMAAGGTVFTAGAGYFLIKIQNLDTADAVASLNASVTAINANL